MSAFLVDELIALELKYHVQDLPEALTPEGWFSACSSLRSLSEFIGTSELLDFHCCSSAIGKENAERPGRIASF